LRVVTQHLPLPNRKQKAKNNQMGEESCGIIKADTAQIPKTAWFSDVNLAPMNADRIAKPLRIKR
jgi:hypothetical protein